MHVFQSAGLSEKYCSKYGTRLCTLDLLDWADRIYVMESMHASRVVDNAGEHYLEKIMILDIDDIYQHMQPELLDELKKRPLEFKK
jgi:predicted protein tyrosine phosphatase